MRLQCSASSWGSKLSGAHKMSVLGLDVGTSTCKGVVLSADGSILAQEQYAYADAVRLDGPKAELPPSCFEDSVKTIVAALAARCKDDPIRASVLSPPCVTSASACAQPGVTTRPWKVFMRVRLLS